MRAKLYDPDAPKRAVNLSINSDLLRQARALDVNLSQVLEERLSEILREKRRRQWIEENRDAMEDYEAFLEKHGPFGDEWRTF